VSLKLVTMGTGDFAVPTFLQLLESTHQVVGLYTQPDRPTVGRHRQHHPMRDLAVERGVPLFQPERVNLPDELEKLRGLGADLFVVAAYGQILSRKLLAIPRLGTINSHASLLPKYRGASPINCAILNGESRTGVTVIEIVPELDAGPMLGIAELEILPDETAGELEVRLAALAPGLVLRVVNELEQGTVTRVPQDPAQVTYAPKLSKEMGLIDWSQPADRVQCQIRAMQPWPNPVSFLHQTGKPSKRVVIRRVSALSKVPSGASAPGMVVHVDKSTCRVSCGGGTCVDLVEIQPDGKRSLQIGEYLRGYAIQNGDCFTSSL